MLVQLGTENIELMGKGKLKAAIQKVGKKISSSKPVQKIVKSKPVQKIAQSKPVKAITKTKAGKIALGVLAAPLMPTLATTALATGAAAGTTALTAKTAQISTKIAASPFKKIAQIKKANAEKKAEQQAIIEAERQAQIDSITPETVLKEQGYTIDQSGAAIPVSSRTDAGIVTQVSPTAKVEEQKKNDFLKYAIPIGIAALSLLSNN